MASLASGAEGLAVATVVPASNALRYVFISCGESQSYFVRSDGAVDRSTVSLHLPPPTHQPPSRFSARTFPSFVHSGAHLLTYLLARSLKQGGGKVSHTINPPPGTKFIAASSGDYASYLLRDDGVVSRTTGGGKSSNDIHPPGKARYVAVSAGDSQSYFLRDDGVVDRTKGKGVIQTSIEPPAGCTYTSVSAGNTATYLVRSDGLVDRIGEGVLFDGKGVVTETMQCANAKVRYTQASGGLNR